MSFDQTTFVNLLKANVNNMDLTDLDFRMFVRNCLNVKDKTAKSYGLLTAEMLLCSSQARRGGEYFGVINKAHAEGRRRAHSRGQVIVHSSMDHKKYFFSDDHCFGYPLLPKDWVPCSMYTPYSITARPGFEDGMLKNVDEICRLHYEGYELIETLDDLVTFLNGVHDDIEQRKA